MCDTSQKIMLDMLKNGDKYRAIRNKWTADHHDCCLWEVLEEGMKQCAKTKMSKQERVMKIHALVEFMLYYSKNFVEGVSDALKSLSTINPQVIGFEITNNGVKKITES